LETTFNVRGSLYIRSDNTTRYHIFGRKLAASPVQPGIPIGRKWDASIPRTVIESGQVIPFIRGIYHAEGSICQRYSKRYNRHPRIYTNLLTIQIRMKLPTLMNQLQEELEKLDITTNRLTCKEGAFTLRITSRAMIGRFLDTIRPRYKTSPRQAIL
jgi:intein/homing endonuclease